MPRPQPQPSDAEGPLHKAKELTNAVLVFAQGMGLGLMSDKQLEGALLQLAFALRDQINKAAEELGLDIGA